MFYNNYDNVHGEDRWGLVGQVGDDFREDRKLTIPCYQCQQVPLIIAERNWVDTNDDDSQCYQIVVVCEHCGAVDEFIVNDGQNGKISCLRHSKRAVSPADLINHEEDKD